MRPGDVVYETIDGGGMLARVVGTIGATDQVLVRLAPDISRIKWDVDSFKKRGYIVFHRSSLTPVR